MKRRGSSSIVSDHKLLVTILSLVWPREKPNPADSPLHRVNYKKMNEKITKQDRSEAAAILGKKGGKSLVKKHGKGYMKKIGKSGGDKRWGNK